MRRGAAEATTISGVRLTGDVALADDGRVAAIVRTRSLGDPIASTHAPDGTLTTLASVGDQTPFGSWFALRQREGRIAAAPGWIAFVADATDDPALRRRRQRAVLRWDAASGHLTGVATVGTTVDGAPIDTLEAGWLSVASDGTTILLAEVGRAWRFCGAPRNARAPR